MTGQRIFADYLIETALDPRAAADAMAGEQSSGTFAAIPGETPELKARSAARVESLRMLEDAAEPSLPGTAIIMLDAAAPHAGELPERGDVTYFVTHPCHPPIFNDETEPAAKTDYFGGNHAKQHIVCALMQGPDEHYALCQEISRTIFKPVMCSHRVTVENLAALEPALSETVGATMALALREATDEAVKRGVPAEAAQDFIIGHLNIELAIAFNIFPEGQFSDGALQAIADAKSVVFKDDWLERVFDPDSVLRSVRAICGTKPA